MGLKVKQQPTESDHMRDTLTNVVAIVGEPRQDLKRLESKVDAYRQEVCARLDQQDHNHQNVCSRLDRQDADISEIKATMKLILSRLPAK